MRHFIKQSFSITAIVLVVTLMLSNPLSATAVSADSDVAINSTNFPDSTFRIYISDHFDSDNNGSLSASEINNIIEIKLAGYNCSNLTGLEYFTQLKHLDCWSNQLTNLDVSKNIQLEYLDCGYNKLTSLDLSKNIRLEYLYCNGNSLANLDLSDNVALIKLVCRDNKLTSIDVSNNLKLEALNCAKNNLSSINVSKNTSLTELYCWENQLASIDVSNNKSLIYFDCTSNSLSSLDVSYNISLTYLACYGNQLTSLNISNNGSLAQAYRVGEIYTPIFGDGSSITRYYISGDAYNEITLSNDIVTLLVDTSVLIICDGESISTNSSFGDFVERLYSVALDRESDPSGKNFWVETVKSGNNTGADCARGFLTSKEFHDKNLSSEDFLKVLYKTFFDRQPDESGMSYWLWILESSSQDQVVEGFINSREWCDICASYGVKSGASTAKATEASKNAIEFATRLYTKCLGRDPEAEGLKFWSLSLTNLEVSGSGAARQFFYSAEFESLKTNDDEYITRLYRTFMGREPDDDGMSYWLECMKNGMTRDTVFDSFVSSNEFTNICKEYGIDR